MFWAIQHSVDSDLYLGLFLVLMFEKTSHSLSVGVLQQTHWRGEQSAMDIQRIDREYIQGSSFFNVPNPDMRSYFKTIRTRLSPRNHIQMRLLGNV